MSIKYKRMVASDSQRMAFKSRSDIEMIKIIIQGYEVVRSIKILCIHLKQQSHSDKV